MAIIISVAEILTASNSMAGFGEAYYQATPDVKLTAGLRWTDDSKHSTIFPAEGVPAGRWLSGSGIVRQEWKEWTGRFVADWTPKLDFHRSTLVYVHIRADTRVVAQPPDPESIFLSPHSSLTHPATFAPEFVNAYELERRIHCLMAA